MLLQLEPDQVSGMWDSISQGIQVAIPDITKDDLLSILNALVNNTMQCWLYTDSEGKVIFMCTTQINIIMPENNKVLLVREICGVRSVAEDDWVNALGTIRGFARKNGCTKIVGYSNQANMISIAQRLGADIETRFIQVEV